jgi:Flp pilus assembly CpaE family ATPase
MHFKGISTETENGVRAGLFLEDQGVAQQIKSLLEASGFQVGLQLETRGASSFLHKVAPGDFAELDAVVVDVMSQKDPVNVIREVHERCPSSSKLIAIGRENDLGFYRRLRAVGAAEYFAHPVPTDELVQSLRLLCTEEGCSLRSGRMIVVQEAHGGAGAGVLTAGLGVLISQMHGRSTVLLDTDFFSPSVGCHLGVDQPGNLAVLLDATERLDKVLIDQAVQKPHDLLALLDGYDGVASQRRISPESAHALAMLLGEEHRYQIWRNGAATPLLIPSLSQADVVILVMTGSLAAARMAQTTLLWLAEHNPSARVIPVYNHVTPHPAIPASSLEEIIRHPVAYTIPYQRKLNEMMLRNVPFNNPSHCLHKILSRLCRDVLGVRETGRTWWRGGSK